LTLRNARDVVVAAFTVAVLLPIALFGVLILQVVEWWLKKKQASR
jgi:hypothetical protein